MIQGSSFQREGTVGAKKDLKAKVRLVRDWQNTFILSQ